MMHRHLISAADLSLDDAVTILDTAEELAQVAERPIRKLPTLRGRTVVNLFYEDSTRTRISFEAAPTLLPVAVGCWPCSVSYDLAAVLPDSDVVMMLRVQHERMSDAYFPSVREYSRRYGLDGDRMALLPEHAIVMHPGPMNRGVEIAAGGADAGRATSVQPGGNGG